jgi:alpha/beta superfamily hydrolase
MTFLREASLFTVHFELRRADVNEGHSAFSSGDRPSGINLPWERSYNQYIPSGIVAHGRVPQFLRMHYKTPVFGILGPLLLVACGGHGDDSNSVATTSASSGGSSTARGTLLQNPPVLLSSSSAAVLLAQVATDASSQTFGTSVLAQVLALSGTPPCDVNVYHIEYNTVGGANEPTTASGALMVPSGTSAACSGARPIVLYAHGTTTERGFNIADLTDEQNAEGILMAVFFAARGYIVVAPNYAGYDTSTLTYHPFLVADQQSKDMIDALTAARTALPNYPQVTDSGQLFVTGYSQGGYVAMATHLAMQAAGIVVTASAPMSGPYALAAFVDAEFEGEVSGGAPIVSTLLLTAYQKSYGNIYSDPTDVFAPQYAPTISNLLPTTMTRSEIYSEGLLPESALFDSTPPASAYAGLTPATTPAVLAPVFATGFGTDGLITNAYRLSYLEDEQANPDGGFPTVTNDLPAATPGLTWRKVLKLNDLRSWTPAAPLMLCGGDQDPEVFYMNTLLMQTYWADHAPVSTPVSVLDLDSSTPSSGTDGSIQAGFQVAKQAVAAAAIVQGATDGGTTAVFEAYHATLVAPFCLAAVINFFNSLTTP